MDNRFEKVIAVKMRSHRSWNNFYAAANKPLGLAYSFGTEKVKNHLNRTSILLFWNPACLLLKSAQRLKKENC